MDALPHAARRKRRNIINVCGKRMSSSACAKGTFAFRPICITPSGTLTGSSAWLLRESARKLAKDCRGWRGSRGRILRRVAGARGCAGGDDWTSGLCRKRKEERTFPRHVAISGECASRGLHRTQRGARCGNCSLLCEDTDNAEAARALAPLLAPGALVLSMQNGVDNVEQIRAAAAIDALPAVVY